MTVAQMTVAQQRDAEAKSLAKMIQEPAMMKQIALAVPKHVTPERLARMVLNQVRAIPALLSVDRTSFLGAIMQAAQLGLEPGVQGECWILPFKGKAVFVPGYRGLAQLAWRSGMIASMCARAVYEGDDFDFDFGEDKLRHKPKVEPGSTPLTHVYAIVHTTTGGRLWDVMTRAEVETVRKAAPSATASTSPWITHYGEMAKKTVFRRLCKLAPSSVELRTAQRHDEAADRGEPQTYDFDVPQLPEPTGEGEAPAIEVEKTDEPKGGADVMALLKAAIELRAKKQSKHPIRAGRILTEAIEKKIQRGLDDFTPADIEAALAIVETVEVQLP